MSRQRNMIVLSLVALAVLVFGAARADAADEFGIAAFDGQVTADAGGDPYTQAGGHPYEGSTHFQFSTRFDAGRDKLVPIANPKDIEIELPPGLVGNPNAIPHCSYAAFFGSGGPECDLATVVGMAQIEINGTPTRVRVFNLPVPADAPALFAFKFLVQPIFIKAEVRSNGDYGINLSGFNTSQGVELTGVKITMWGDPSDPTHDVEREGPSPAAPVGFLTLPTRCTEPGVGLRTSMRVNSWQDPAKTVEASFMSHLPPHHPLPPSEWGPEQGPTGCENVPFEPTFSAQPTTNAAASPVGLGVDISIPQEAFSDPDVITQSHMKKAEVVLPLGMKVNPASADGLAACGSAEIGLASTADPSCPEDSKIGQVRIETPVLEDDLTGAVYLAKQGDNPFNSLLALYVVAKGPGVTIKLPGRIDADPATGQLTATFDNNPQLPFSDLHVQFKGGARAPLTTPRTCGTYAIKSTLTPWSGGPAVVQNSPFQITQGPGGAPCPDDNQFDPKLSAGTTSPVAGAYSPFVMRLTRADGSREVSGLNVTLPPGLTGKLAGIPYCPEGALAAISASQGTGKAQLDAPSCPAASQVATVTVGAGSGANPFYLETGKAYLAGPYRGAPLSLAIVTPAVAGPFDLGSVVVRAALRVDPETAVITAVSDPLPTILYGIPLDLRSVEVDMSKPGFTLNPTSCDPMAVAATVSGVGGASANLSSPFQVGNCPELGFKPKLSFKLKGATKRGKYPALEATLKARPGDANIARAAVTLPHSAFLAQEHIKTICTRVQYAADSCPKASIYGYAKATTPLLDQPLEGPVYLRSSANKLPDLVAALRGQIEVDLVGRIDSVNGGIRNTFELVPDAPVSRFTLSMQGGRKGLLVNSRNICKSVNRVNVLLDGQNGKTADQTPVLANDCGKKAKKKKKRKK